MTRKTFYILVLLSLVYAMARSEEQNVEDTTPLAEAKVVVVNGIESSK